MKTLKLFLLPLLDSLEFACQVIRYALIFVWAFFRHPLHFREGKPRSTVMYLSLRFSSDALAALEVELLHFAADSQHESKFGDFSAVWPFAVGR